MNTTDLLPIPPRPVWEVYRGDAIKLAQAFRLGEAGALQRARKFHPRFFKMPEAHISVCDFSGADAEMVIALEHGFQDWEAFAEHIDAMQHKDSPIAQFEAAADAIVTGDVTRLKELIHTNPDLIQWRSDRVHRVTLLHYIAANGIENYRQRTPANVVAVALVLLQAGAKADAFANTYNNQWSTPMDLLVSSLHPARAGLQTNLVHALLDFGAAVNGVFEDGSPLMTALYFHYPAAAEALAARGATINTLPAAAGLGREELVDQWLSDNGTLEAGIPLVKVPWMELSNNSANNITQALSWATMHRRTGVVKLMLKKGVDPGMKDRRGWTALHWAAYCGYPELVAILLQWQASTESENEFGGTVLDQTIWRTVHEQFLPEHIDIIHQLIDAGAQVTELADWYLRPAQHPVAPEPVAALLRKYASLV